MATRAAAGRPQGSASVTASSARTRVCAATVADILRLKKPPAGFLCPNASTPPVQFARFQIKDAATNEVGAIPVAPAANTDFRQVFFEIGHVPDAGGWMLPDGAGSFEPDDSTRTIAYSFPKTILTAASIETNLIFAVGPVPLNNFRMIENHYFKDKLIKSFDFTFGFCIPNSVNTWENIYKVPKLDQRTISEMIASPDKTVSDSFYFVDDKLVMHNKAYYSYH
ncbi:hypothetical protein HDU82_006470 [Entophlyctis luteolus]|nr:hypothetical protein HDU82_006470 [Entophlyctis luteolus]